MSQFNILDLGASLAANLGATHLAATSAAGSLRLPVLKGRDSWWNDWRLAVGAGAALIGSFVPERYGMLRRGAMDIATGGLHSYIATERVRAVSIKRAAGSGWGAGQSVVEPGKLAAPVGPAALPGGATQAGPVPVRRVTPVSGIGWGA